MDKEEVQGILKKNRKLNFVQRIEKPVQSIKNPDGSVSTHSMAWGETNTGGVAFPTVIKDKRTNRLYRLSSKAAAKYARTTGENIQFKTAKEAKEFSTDYKKVWK